MNIEEHAAKPVLADAGIAVPDGILAASAVEAGRAARRLGCPVVVKAQVPAGKRGKAGGIARATGPAEAGAAARRILGMEIGGHRVRRVLVEGCVDIAREHYAAVLNDPASRSPVLLYSTAGGMDVEEAAERHPDRMRRLAVDIRAGLDRDALAALLGDLDLGCDPSAGLEFAERLYAAYRASDAELLEVNPLAVTTDGRLVALDCKLTVDDSARPRQQALGEQAAPEPLTDLERRGREAGLRYIELDGAVGVLANGAGLTMTTMDVVAHHGGRPANFLEIGGDAYTQARPALELVLANPRVRSLVVNFCGAFARTDVMMSGVVEAWESLAPDLPVFFSVQGTGAAEARAMLRERLGHAPCVDMDEAVSRAVTAAREASR